MSPVSFADAAAEALVPGAVLDEHTHALVVDAVADALLADLALAVVLAALPEAHPEYGDDWVVSVLERCLVVAERTDASMDYPALRAVDAMRAALERARARLGE